MIRRLCPTCSKKRIERLFPKGHRMCELCKIAKANGIKKERKEASQRTWIERCDKIVGVEVRARNKCESPRPHACKKNWQWCHGISRSYHNTRHLEENSFCMCSSEHYYFTNHPLEWDNFLEKRWGTDSYRYLKTLALDPGSKPDFKMLYKQLTEAK